MKMTRRGFLAGLAAVACAPIAIAKAVAAPRERLYIDDFTPVLKTGGPWSNRPCSEYALSVASLETAIRDLREQRLHRDSAMQYKAPTERELAEMAREGDRYLRYCEAARVSPFDWL